MAGPPAPRPTPPNALSEAERQRVLSVLRSEEYCDLAPAQVWARLLDDGIYLCSISTARVLGSLTLPVHAEAPVETLRQMIYAYPTFHRASKTPSGT